MRAAIVAIGLISNVSVVYFAQPIAPIVAQNLNAAEMAALGESYQAKFQYEAAINAYQQALVVFQGAKDTGGEARVLMRLGQVHEAMSRYEIAIEYHQRALSLAKQINNRLAEAEILVHLGQVYRAMSQYDKAIDSHQTALVIFRQLKQRRGEAWAIGNLGDAYKETSQYGKAMEHYQQAHKIFRELQDLRGEAGSLGNLGQLHQGLAKFEEAISYHTKALALFRQLQDLNGEALALGDLGTAYVGIAQPEKAIEYYQQALPIFRRINKRTDEAATLAALGNAYATRKKYVEAIAYHKQALDIVQEIKNRRAEAKQLSTLGRIYGAVAQCEDAIRYLQPALTIARQSKDAAEEGFILSNIGNVFLDQKQPELAIAFYKLSVNVYESIRQDLRKLPRETQETYTSFVAIVYRRLADALLAQGRNREAQEILELLKVQETSSYNAKPLGNPGIMQLTLHPLEQQAIRVFETAIAQHQILRLNDFKPLQTLLEQNRDRLIQEGNTKKMTIGNPQALLATDTLVIQNLVFGDRLWVLWSRPSGETKTVVMNLSQDELHQTVDRFRRQITDRGDLNQLQASSQMLYNWLIPMELQTELKQDPKRHLIFSLDHVTRYVPIAALHDGSQYLIQRYQLSNIITTAMTPQNQVSPKPEDSPVLAVGVSQSFGEFPALPNVPSELAAIVKQGNQGIYPGVQKLNEAFTLKELRKDLKDYRILHIATHGKLDTKQITKSYLLLGDGSRLPIDEIEQLANLKNLHLVVLSACETGLGRVAGDGTEISGMGAYFLDRGAKSVVASLWPVDDASTALMMQKFYKYMAAGNSKASALRQAQIELLQITSQDAKANAISQLSRIPMPISMGKPRSRSSGYDHPYYWAAFVLTGNSL